MEREANYFAVGAFVLLVVAMAVLFVYWYSASSRRGDYRLYEIYFDGSVSGLAVGSPVRYLGVDVGQVRAIQLDPRSAGRVQVVVQIKPDTPIDSDTVAQLSLQGVTGVLYIDLRRRPQDAAGVLANVPSQHYPVIASMHSNLDVLLGSLPQLASSLDEVLERSSRLLSDRNLTAADRIVSHLDQSTQDLPQTMREVAGLVGDLRRTVGQANAVLTAMHGATRTAAGDVASTARQLREASANLERTSARLDRLVADNGASLTELLGNGVPQVEALLRDSRAAVQQIDQLARSLAQNPSQLIYQPRANGVAIPP